MTPAARVILKNNLAVRYISITGGALARSSLSHVSSLPGSWQGPFLGSAANRKAFGGSHRAEGLLTPLGVFPTRGGTALQHHTAWLDPKPL